MDGTQIKWMNSAFSFLEAGETLRKIACDNSSAEQFSGPVFFVFGHALELGLKALLISLGQSEEKIARWGHDPKKVLDAIFQHQGESGIKEQLVSQSRDLLKHELRSFRDHDWALRLNEPKGDLLKFAPNQFGFVTNEQIGQALNRLPLLATIDWFSKMMTTEGGAFRYVQLGLHHYPTIRLANRDISIDTLWVSSLIRVIARMDNLGFRRAPKPLIIG
ncbi:hypothetical protein [Shimia ponticola]|uniref:hypothetical protein n=1 Tax=Shimia ponticola TaxID=2582893 RepID=UPI0011BEBF01|nr:hypothetical protein [Shimia ponticola]